MPQNEENIKNVIFQFNFHFSFGPQNWVFQLFDFPIMLRKQKKMSELICSMYSFPPIFSIVSTTVRNLKTNSSKSEEAPPRSVSWERFPSQHICYIPSIVHRVSRRRTLKQPETTDGRICKLNFWMAPVFSFVLGSLSSAKLFTVTLRHRPMGFPGQMSLSMRLLAGRLVENFELGPFPCVRQDKTTRGRWRHNVSVTMRRRRLGSDSRNWNRSKRSYYDRDLNLLMIIKIFFAALIT